MLDPDIGSIIVAGVAVLLFIASVQKWRSLDEFKQVLLVYRLVPEVTLSILTLAIPVLEATISVTLLFSRTRIAAAYGAATLLGLYGVAVAINLARGRVSMDCGCGGRLERRPIGAWMVVRNMIIGTAVGFAGAPWADRSVSLVDVFTVSAGIIVLIALYAAIDQLFGQKSPDRIRSVL